MKKCKVCGEIKGLEDFVKSKTFKDGRRNECKVCTNLQKRLNAAPTRISNKLKKEFEKITKKEQLLKEPHKTCTVCNKNKLKETAFNINTKQMDGYNPMCKQCKNTRESQARLANLETARVKDRLYISNNKEMKAKSDAKYREANKEKLAAHKKLYYEANKTKLSEYNRVTRLNKTPEQIKERKLKNAQKYLIETEVQKQRRKEYGLVYHKTPSGKLSSVRNAHKRRALKLSQDDGTVTAQALEELKELQKHKCYYCNEPLDYGKTKAVHLDHYIPLSEGGLHSITNVVWSCGPCNWSKGNTIPMEPLKIPDRMHFVE